MKREKLAATKREITGKRVRHLRKDGILPTNLYGKDIPSQALELSLKDFENVFSEVHETGLVDLTVDKDTVPVLIKNVQIHPTTYTPLHADFFKVNLKEKVRSQIPVVAVGEPKAVVEKIGVLLQTLNEIEVEALPAELPESIEVNVEGLTQIDDSITVGDLKVASGIEILTEPVEMIFRISELVSEEAEELAEEEAAAAEEAAEGSEAEATTSEEKKDGDKEGKEESSEDKEDKKE